MSRHLAVAPDIEIYRPLTKHAVMHSFSRVEQEIASYASRLRVEDQFAGSVALLHTPRVHLLPRSELEKATRSRLYRAIGARTISEHLNNALVYRNSQTRNRTLTVRPLNLADIEHANSVEVGYQIEDEVLRAEQQTVIETLSSLTGTTLDLSPPMLTFAHLFNRNLMHVVKTGAVKVEPATLILDSIRVDVLASDRQ